MTFSPVVPGVLLIAVAVVALALRLLTMWRLAGAGQRWTTVWRWSGLTLAVALLLIAAARPALGGGATHQTAGENGGPDVFLVVDRSSDLAAIRDDIGVLLDDYPQARFALITFAARPSLDWPLSQDNWSLSPTVAGLRPQLDPAGGVNAAAAATVLRYQLIAAGQRSPGGQSLVFYFGSGAPGSPAPQGRFEPVAGSVDGGAVFGYGADRDDDRLRGIADQLGLPFQVRDRQQPLRTPESAAAPQDRPTPSAPERTELYWVFALTAALLLLIEIHLTVREYRQVRR